MGRQSDHCLLQWMLLSTLMEPHDQGLLLVHSWQGLLCLARPWLEQHEQVQREKGQKGADWALEWVLVRQVGLAWVCCHR